MAIAARDVTGCSTKPMTTFTMGVGPNDWEPEGNPQVGDLMILNVIQPGAPVISPPGWTMLDNGRTFWKLVGPAEPPVVTFTAPGALDWEIRGFVAAAGSWAALEPDDG